MEKQFEIYTMNVYNMGDLKGYADGLITFKYNDTEHDHEFLFRIDDAANGENNTLVSIDYGYNVPNINEMWSEIENEIGLEVAQCLVKN